MNLIKKYKRVKSRSLTQLLLFLTVVTTCLGDVLNIFGLKLSWMFAGLSVVAFIYEYFRKRYTFPLGTLNLKIVSGFFVVWLVYASVQMLIIDRNANALTFYRFLAVNIFLVLMLILNTKSLNDVVFFSKALIAGYFINLIIVIWELYTGKQAVNVPVEPGFVYGVFANVNDLCTVLAFGIFALLFNMLLTKKNMLISITAIIFSVYIIYIDDSRAPLLSLILLLFFWGVFEVSVLLYQKSRTAFICYMSVLVAVPVVAAIVILTKYHVDQLVSMLSSEATVASDSLRVELAEKALVMTKDSRFLGVGPGQSVEIIGVNIHNFFLEVLAEYGVLIFAGIVYLFVVIFTAYRTQLPRRVSSLLMAFVPFFAVASISSSSAAKIKATWVIITLLFLAVVYSRTKKENTAEEPSKVEES